MVIKEMFYLLFMIVLPAVNAQNIRTIEIDATKSVNELNLSEIASEVIPISMQNSNNYFNDVFFTDKYIFVAAHKEIFQYDLTGKLIGTIRNEKMINSLTGDISGNLLIVAVDTQLLIYDFSLRLKETLEVKYPVYSCFLHKNKVWIQSCGKLSENEHAIISRISYWDINTRNEIFTSYKHITPPPGEGLPFNIMPKFSFSLLKNKIVFTFPTSDTLYEIEDKRDQAIIKWNIHPPAKSLYEKGLIEWKGIIGKYLFVNYCRTLTKNEVLFQNTSYLYIKDMQSKKTYNVKSERSSTGTLLSGIKDDIYHTGFCKIKKVIHPNEYLFFVKDKTSLQSKNVDNLPLREGNILFLVKVK